MKLKTGIVGMPNVGKSTLFNAVTEAQGAMCANYPFATIEPNIGVVEVPDSRWAGVRVRVVFAMRVVEMGVGVGDWNCRNAEHKVDGGQGWGWGGCGGVGLDWGLAWC